MIIIKKYLLIAEKPSLMRDCKSTYLKHKRKIPYDIDFVALSGHVCCYANPKDYPNWDLKWEELTLPIIPETWKINIISDKYKMFSDIKKTIEDNNYDGFICATDADREGNLIYHLFETKLKLTKKPTLRLWVHDLTDEKILEAFLNMKDYHKDAFQRNLTLASVLRSRFDWMVGMNTTISASLKANMLMKIGRVKSPTLKLVYDNSMAIDNFISKTTYTISSEYETNPSFKALCYNEKGELLEFDKREDAIKFISKLSDTAIVKSIDKKITKTQAPQLYKLSDVQIQASKKYGYSPKKTLDLIQVLYEKHKLVSYPRCDCRYVSTSLASEFVTHLDVIKSLPDFAQIVSTISIERIEEIKKNKKYINDEEVNKNSHTALMPTTKIPDLSQLSEDEKNILKMIYSRFLSIFLPPLKEEVISVELDNNNHKFKTTGKVVIDAGFTKILEKNHKDVILPKLEVGDRLKIKKTESKDKITSPPARLTDGTLIEEMANIGKYAIDSEYKQILKEVNGIGTQATRSNIIAELIKDGYIDTKISKKTTQLYISEKGKVYIENLKDFEIINPELTAVWEDKLRGVENGEIDSVAFNKSMLDFIKKMILNISKITMNKASPVEKKSLGKCPRCGKDVVEGKKSFGCLGFRDNPKCDFSIWKENGFFKSQGKKLTSSIVEKLLSDKQHKTLVKGFKSKNGNKYDAYVILDDKGSGFVNLNIEFKNK